MTAKNPVARVVRRHAKPGCEDECEALLKGLVEASSHFPGYLFATVIPPHTGADNDPYQVVHRFATQEDLDRWDASPERAHWRERLDSIAQSDAGFYPVTGLEAWCAPPARGAAPPPKWKLTVVSWLGIFPLVSLSLGLLGPLLASWPFLARILVVTMLVVFLMSYVVMPRLVVWMGWWLRKK